MGYVIVAIVVAMILAMALRSIKYVKSGQVGLVERLGSYVRTIGPGLSTIVPFIDRLRYTVDLGEQVVTTPPFDAATRDDRSVTVQLAIRCQVTDPVRATYEIASYREAVAQIAAMTAPAMLAEIDAARVLVGSNQVRARLVSALEATVGEWGLKVLDIDLEAREPTTTVDATPGRGARALVDESEKPWDS